jgi:hypothetical protein
MRIGKTLLAIGAASILLGALASAASAGRFSTSNQNWRVMFREFILELAWGRTVCQVTMEGALHARTFAKVFESLVGYITAARLGPCSAGSLTILTETLPWHTRYESFIGTLPQILFVRTRIIRFCFRVREPLGLVYLGISLEGEPAILEFRRNTLTGELNSAHLGGTISTSPFGERATLSGSATINVLGTIRTFITVTLI